MRSKQLKPLKGTKLTHTHTHPKKKEAKDYDNRLQEQGKTTGKIDILFALTFNPFKECQNALATPQRIRKALDLIRRFS